MTPFTCPTCGGRLDPMGDGTTYICRLCGEAWDAEDLDDESEEEESDE